jgi:hypothetical protein
MRVAPVSRERFQVHNYFIVLFSEYKKESTSESGKVTKRRRKRRGVKIIDLTRDLSARNLNIFRWS